MGHGPAKFFLATLFVAAVLQASPAVPSEEPAVEVERLYLSHAKIAQGDSFRMELRLGANEPWLLTAPPPPLMGRAPGEIPLPARLKFQSPHGIELELLGHSPDGIRDWRDADGQLRYGSRGVTFRLLATQREPLRPGEYWIRVTVRSLLMNPAGEEREEVLVFRFPLRIVKPARRRLTADNGHRSAEPLMYVPVRYVVESTNVVAADAEDDFR